MKNVKLGCAIEANLAKWRNVAVLGAASLAFCSGFSAPAKAQSVEREIINNIIQSVLQSVRDQIQRRQLVTPPGTLRFSAEESQFDSRNPLATMKAGDPFQALAYAKAPAVAVAPAQLWLYGFTATGSADRSYTFFSDTRSAAVSGTFDVTKIGIFTASDALTFMVTGADVWSHTVGVQPLAPWFDSTTPSGAGTISYTNGGFSTDFTVQAAWTRNTPIGALLLAPPDSSSLSYTGNVQYKFEFPYSFWFEPTVGVTYAETYTANFGTKIADTTEVHAGGRIGTEMKWMGYTVQPSMGGQVFKIVDFSPSVLANVSDQIGGRGFGKINVIWTPNFSTYVEAHGSGVAGTKTLGFVSTNAYGATIAARYSW